MTVMKVEIKGGILNPSVHSGPECYEAPNESPLLGNEDSAEYSGFIVVDNCSDILFLELHAATPTDTSYPIMIIRVLLMIK